MTFVGKLLSRNDVAVLAPTLSPYRKARETAQKEKEVEDLVEVYRRYACLEVWDT
ncbi:MAG: hypothetical protein B6D35_06310 [Candidatus Brocadia sp. UTAMX2]|nr:MAG: hypothetical protein B6D35_06310 [Candidatus Brocadia sp. UTAMX2]